MRINEPRIVRDVVVIGASAGGLDPNKVIMGSLAPSFPGGIAVVFHRNRFSDGMLLPILGDASRLPVVEPWEGQPFAHQTVFLAPRDRHLILGPDGFHLSRGPALHFARPAIDALFCSAAESFGPRVVGVILSGCGFDGARGSLAIKARGGMMLAQAPEEASFPFMPKHAIQEDHVDAILALPEIICALQALAEGEVYER